MRSSPQKLGVRNHLDVDVRTLLSQDVFDLIASADRRGGFGDNGSRIAKQRGNIAHRLNRRSSGRPDRRSGVMIPLAGVKRTRDRARKVLAAICRPLYLNAPPIIYGSRRTAELTKNVPLLPSSPPRSSSTRAAPEQVSLQPLTDAWGFHFVANSRGVLSWSVEFCKL